MKDIFYMVETRFFYWLLPNQTLSLKGENCLGGKMSEDRLTAANMDGSQYISQYYLVCVYLIVKIQRQFECSLAV